MAIVAPPPGRAPDARRASALTRPLGLRAGAPRLMPWGLAALCFLLAFVQRPGVTYTDSRIDLTTDPALFLHRVTSVWSATGDLGHVASAQYVGYLFPMGTWYAFAERIGVPPWVAERLWLGALLAFAAWGAVRLMDELFDRQRGLPHVVAGLAFALNPYVIVFASRASVTLLAHAVLPWMMIAVHRGVRAPRSWQAPAALGLLGAVSGGGVNAAVLACVVIAPAGLVVYELAVLRRPVRCGLSFLWRAVVCGVGASAWWIVPTYLQGRYGADFLRFTEQPSAIWATTSMSESLRLLGYWVTYLGTGYGRLEPVMSIGRLYLFNPAVLVSSLAVPALALGGLRWTRRWTYAPFFGLLAVIGLLVMYTGFPDGTLMRSAIESAYYRFSWLDFLRTTYKAAPVVALSIACLGGAAAGAAMQRLRRRRGAAWFSLGVIAALLVLWALPLFTGTAIDRRLAYGSVPRSWSAALSDADATMAPGRRIMILPGQLFGDYRWGRTWDSIAPALTRRSVLIRQAVRYADPRSAQLVDAVDDLVQQRRLVPGQLRPLLRLLGVGQVIVANDSQVERSGGLDPVGAVTALRRQAEFARPAKTYGRVRSLYPASGRGGRPVYVPDLARYDVEGGPPAGLVRIDAGERPVVFEGDGDGVTEMAAAGLLEPGRALFNAADLSSRELRNQLALGAALVLTDSGRRRIVSPNRTRQSTGPTLAANNPFPRDAARYEFLRDGEVARQTVAAFSGIARLEAPISPGAPLLPASSGYAALDRRLDTAWLPDPFLSEARRSLYIRLRAPIRARSISVIPEPIVPGRPLRIAISENGRPERMVTLRDRENDIRLSVSRLSSIRVRLAGVSASSLVFGGGGIAELKTPGLRVRRTLRLPTAAAEAARGVDLSHSEVSVLLRRTTADDPYRAGNDTGAPSLRSATAMRDVELGIRRIVTLPTRRRFLLGGWATVSPTAPDDAIDRLANAPPAWRINSSSRFEGVPARRASSAFDGTLATAWVGDLIPTGAPGPGRSTSWNGTLADPLPWISWHSPQPESIRTLKLLPSRPEYAFPSVVRVAAPGARSVVVSVSPGGDVVLPHALRTRDLRITVLRVQPASGFPALRLLRAVAIGEIRGLPHPPRRPSGEHFSTRCGAVRVNAARGPSAQARVSGTLRALGAGDPLPLTSCGRHAALSLPAGSTIVDAPPGRVMRVDHLALFSPARARGLAPPPPGTALQVKSDHALLEVSRPAWLVLGQTYSRGWRAWCTDALGFEHALGAPRPIDGYANGWLISPGCRVARFQYRPQRIAVTGYVISGAVVVRLLALLLFGLLTGRLPRARARPAEPVPDEGAARQRSWVASVLLTAGFTILSQLLFGIPIGVLAILPLRRRITTAHFFTAAAILLAAVPVAYLFRGAPDFGGFSSAYPRDNLPGHWLAVGAVCCIAFACVVDAIALRRAAGGGSGGRSWPTRLARRSGSSSR